MGEEADVKKKEEKKSLTQAEFLSWKTQKAAEASAKKAEASRKREEDIAAGLVQMNGRELFKHQPWLFDNNLY
ncbi:hypothetical protein M8C21_031511 [Ambrosia artemisiifolia]|uniref:ZC3H15/TMA46 family C-terminal domain-containing protein n=1 Tax=Ambrosia artemisiifolia TaxID=4212 RepID=A0AAD5GME7_AMBAR|nr:hypothetical protein M8C21_031511 [Ambrosia artemisiifolia]